MTFTFTPLAAGQSLDAAAWPRVSKPGKIIKIDINMIVPQLMHDSVVNSLAFELDNVFPDIASETTLDEDSEDRSRVFLLLIARTENECVFARDWLYDRPTKNADPDLIAAELVEKVVDDLDKEVRRGGVVDEFLDDQLVVFRALAAGRSAVSVEGVEGGDVVLKRDGMEVVSGREYLHAKTARWVASQMMPEVKWYNGGSVCEGVGWKSEVEEADALPIAMEKLEIGIS